MKKISSYLMVPLFLFVVASSAMAAGIQPDSFTLSGIVGGYSFDGKQHLETRPVVGIRGGYNFTKYVGVEALFDYVPTEGTRTSDDANVYRYGGDVLLHLLPDSDLVPYLAAGYSGISLDRENQKTNNLGVFDYGVGLKYFVTDELALRGDFRHLVFRDGGETLYNYEYTVGVSFQFGGEKPAPPPVPAPVVQPAPEPPLEPVPAAEPAPGHYKYCVTLHMEYDICRADIRPEYHDEVAKIGDFMKKYPTTTAVIEGHTDNVPVTPRCEYKDNMALSQARAEKVVDYLVEKFGIDRSRLSAKGYGFTRPVADNSTNEGKQKNRRIEAIIDCAFVPQEITPPEKLCMMLQMQFDTGKANIKPEYRDEIAKVADYMKKYPTTTAVIEGHTDNVGGYEYNMKLSQARAENVVNYLVDNFGIERSRLSAKGYGYTRSIAYNNTPEGRQKNRRINAVIDCVVKK